MLRSSSTTSTVGLTGGSPEGLTSRSVGLFWVDSNGFDMPCTSLHTRVVAMPEAEALARGSGKG